MSLNIILNKEKKNIELRRIKGSLSLSIRVYPNSKVIVFAPYFIPKIIITHFLNSKKKWIEKKIKFWENSNHLFINKNNSDYLKDKEKALELITQRIDYFNNFYKFNYNKVSIRNQKTRWGSCSKKANLSFNFRLIYLPEKIRDYVIVHELCHLKELNHSSNFWTLISKTIPDYKLRRRELKKILIN